MKVYVAFLGNYNERSTIGVFSTRQAAEEALRARQEWWDEMVALHWPFLNSGEIGPMRAWYDIEGWHVGGDGEPSRWSDD